MFHSHKWGVESAMDGWEGLEDNKRPVTLVLYRCAKCGAFKDDIMRNGNWAKQISAKPPEPVN